MKKLFTAIKQGDLAQVQALIASRPELVHCVSKQPPKKDDGQSPLQVAFKNRHFEIVDYLLDLGADVNYIDSGSINEWKAPLIHDAIMAAVISACSNQFTHGTRPGDRALQSLRKLIELGANVNARDSYGNTCAMRAVLDIRNFCPPPSTGKTAAYLSDVSMIIDLLVRAGADFYEATDTRSSALEIERKGSEVSDFLYRTVEAASTA